MEQLDLNCLRNIRTKLLQMYINNKNEHYFHVLIKLIGLEDTNKLPYSYKSEKHIMSPLFLTYIKMLEQDKHEFFIEKSKRPQFIESLNRTLKYYDVKDDSEKTQKLFQSLRSDDPASFIILPFIEKVSNDDGDSHALGLILHKKENDYVVTLIDRERAYNRSNGNYVTLPQRNLPQFIQLISKKNKLIFERPSFGRCKELAKLSKETAFVPLLIDMERQKAGNCLFSEPEAAIKTALLHCRKDIHKVTSFTSIKLPGSRHSAKKTRQKFLKAMKEEIGEDPEWKPLFKRASSYYIKRKNAKKKITGFKWRSIFKWGLNDAKEKKKLINKQISKEKEKLKNKQISIQALAIVGKKYNNDPLMKQAKQKCLATEVVNYYSVVDLFINFLEMYEVRKESIDNKEELKEQGELIRQTNECIKELEKIVIEAEQANSIDKIKENVPSLIKRLETFYHELEKSEKKIYNNISSLTKGSKDRCKDNKVVFFNSKPVQKPVQEKVLFTKMDGQVQLNVNPIPSVSFAKTGEQGQSKFAQIHKELNRVLANKNHQVVEKASGVQHCK